MLPRHSACKGSAGSGLIVGRGGRPGGQASRNIRTRHYARPRGDAAHITRAHYAAAPRCGARLGIPRVVVRSRCGRARWLSVGAPDSRRRAIGAVRGLALCAKFVSRHYARNIRPRITRAARWGHRALPPLHTQYSHTYRPSGLPTRAAAPLPVAALRAAEKSSPVCGDCGRRVKRRKRDVFG